MLSKQIPYHNICKYLNLIYFLVLNTTFFITYTVQAQTITWKKRTIPFNVYSHSKELKTIDSIDSIDSIDDKLEFSINLFRKKFRWVKQQNFLPIDNWETKYKELDEYHLNLLFSDFIQSGGIKSTIKWGYILCVDNKLKQPLVNKFVTKIEWKHHTYYIDVKNEIGKWTTKKNKTHKNVLSIDEREQKNYFVWNTEPLNLLSRKELASFFYSIDENQSITYKEWIEGGKIHFKHSEHHTLKSKIKQIIKNDSNSYLSIFLILWEDIKQDDYVNFEHDNIHQLKKKRHQLEKAILYNKKGGKVNTAYTKIYLKKIKNRLTTPLKFYKKVIDQNNRFIAQQNSFKIKGRLAIEKIHLKNESYLSYISLLDSTKILRLRKTFIQTEEKEKIVQQNNVLIPVNNDTIKFNQHETDSLIFAFKERRKHIIKWQKELEKQYKTNVLNKLKENIVLISQNNPQNNLLVDSNRMYIIYHKVDVDSVQDVLQYEILKASKTIQNKIKNNYALIKRTLKQNQRLFQKNKRYTAYDSGEDSLFFNTIGILINESIKLTEFNQYVIKTIESDLLFSEKMVRLAENELKHFEKEIALQNEERYELIFNEKYRYNSINIFLNKTLPWLKKQKKNVVREINRH